jgi:hypothetical protein
VFRVKDEIIKLANEQRSRVVGQADLNVLFVAEERPEETAKWVVYSI